MSLFGTINNAAGALSAAQIGLQTVGNNIANANTSGYIRQDLIQTTPAPSRKGNMLIGHGVRPAAIVHRIDQALAERMWEAGSDLAAAKLRQKTFAEVEALVNDLNGGGLNDDLIALNSALHDLSSDPNNQALREFVILSAESLSGEITRTYEGVRDYQSGMNAAISDNVDRVNALATKIADLNRRVMMIEGGRALASDATGLRDERYRALEELSQLVKVNVQEQATGSVSVSIDGDYLVAEVHARELHVDRAQQENSGLIEFVDTGANVRLLGGELKSMVEGRDELLRGVLDGLDALSLDLIRQFNTVHSQGQGRTGFDSLVGTVALEPSEPLQQSGLTWPIDGGSFDIRLVDEAGGHISQHRVEIRMGESSAASNLASIVEDIDAIDGIAAEILASGEISIQSDVPGVRFTFAEDHTGFVAAAGLNTMFSGDGAATIGINPMLKDNPDFLAISSGGVNNDTDTLTRLVDLIDEGVDGEGSQSIQDQYSRVINRLAQTAANEKAAAQGLEQYYATLQSEHLAITGVNVDEEAIKMITYQRAFQASSRVIAAAAEMLEILTSL